MMLIDYGAAEYQAIRHYDKQHKNDKQYKSEVVRKALVAAISNGLVSAFAPGSPEPRPRTPEQIARARLALLLDRRDVLLDRAEFEGWLPSALKNPGGASEKSQRIRGRKKDQGPYVKGDAQLVEEMHRRVQQGKALSSHEAAWQLENEGPIPGAGIPASKVKRLLGRYSEKFSE